jgi:cysteine desulfurase
MTYLDWASTSPPDAGILAEAAQLASQRYGNPSSRHGPGAEAKAGLEEARARLGAALGLGSALGRAAGSRLAFTSGGTEADSIVLLSLVRAALAARRDGSVKKLRVVVSEIEHPAIYEEALLLKSLGFDIAFVKPEADGILDPGRVADAAGRDAALVVVMAVNNETGAIQTLAAIAAALRDAAASQGRHAPLLHADAVQALGKTDFRPAGLGISSAAFSAHKIGGPRGMGALWTAYALEPLAVGGGQEGGLRPGTENLQGAWAFALAAEAAVSRLPERAAAARALEARLFEGLERIPGAIPLPLGRRAGAEAYSPFILSAAFPGLSGEVMVRALADAGIAVSTGAACSSNARRKGRRVLDAMGLAPELSLSAIRISWGEGSAPADIDRFLEASSTIYRRLRA